MAYHSRGFVALPLAGWIAIASAIAIGGLLLALKVQNARLSASEANLEACQSRYAETLKLTIKQNKAVDALQADSEKRSKQAAIAMKRAKADEGSLNAEIARLRAINADALDCSGAVEQVKRGMR